LTNRPFLIFKGDIILLSFCCFSSCFSASRERCSRWKRHKRATSIAGAYFSEMEDNSASKLLYDANLDSLDENLLDKDFDMSNMDFKGLEELFDAKVTLKDEGKDSKLAADATKAMEEKMQGNLVLRSGFSSEPNLALLAASLGQDMQRSAYNDCWAFLQADRLRIKLGWDMSIPLDDVPFEELDLVLSNLFARLRKKNDELYTSETIMNMLGGYNGILRVASKLRAVEGQGQVLENVNIKKRFAFPKTKLVI
jgi:hypothetical protein